MSTKPIQVDDLLKGSLEEDDDVNEAFSGVFEDVDLLPHHSSFQSDMDMYARSRDFSMTETGIGDEDAFGIFEIEPQNNTGSVAGSIDNHESFAGCHNTSTPPTPTGRSKTPGTTDMNGTNGDDTMLRGSLNDDSKPPMTEVYVDFNSMNGPSCSVLDTSSSMYSSEDQCMQHPSGVTNTERYSSPPRRTMSDIPDNRSPRFFNPSPSIQNQYPPQDSRTKEGNSVDDMFHEFSLEQLEPEPIDLEPEPLTHSNNHQFGDAQHQQLHMHHNQVLQQQHYHNSSQVSQPIHLQQMQQSHSQMQNMARQRMPDMQNIQHQQYHTSPQVFAANHQAAATHPSTFQQAPSPTMAMENSSNAFQMMQNHSAHGGMRYHSPQRSMMNHSSHGVPIPPNSLRMSRNSFQGHQPLTSQSYHGMPFRQNDGTMMNPSSHSPVSAPVALNSSFNRDDNHSRNSSSFSDISAVGHPGMQVNVAIQPEQHHQQKYFNGGGYESPGATGIHPMPPTNINDVMEKLSVSMRRSAMSRSMVKHISGRSVVSQNSARGLLASQGSSRGLGPSSHHSHRNVMKQGSERSFVMDARPVPIRRQSINAKHQPPGQSVHRNNSHRNLNHSNHGHVTLQVDDRNVGTL